MIKLIIAAALSLFLFTTHAVAEPRTFLSQVTCNSDSQLPFDIVEQKPRRTACRNGQSMAIMDARTKRKYTQLIWCLLLTWKAEHILSSASLLTALGVL